MKNFTNRKGSLLLLLLFIFFCPLSWAQPCNSENWVLPLPQGNQLTYVDFISPTTGYATGFHGTIIKTIDGGNSWQTLSTGTSVDLFHIQFINSNVGLASGAEGTILKTTNGGSSWTIIHTRILSNLTSLHFPTLNTGYATAADGSILKSTDNGDSWTLLNSGTTETLKSIFFTSNTTGIAVGGSTIPGPRNSYHSFMTRTTDGGITWTPYVLPRSIPLTRITFFNELSGITAGGHPDGSHAAPEGTVLITSDGGVSWNEVFYGNQAVNSFDFASDQQTGIAIGNYGTIKSVDGGNSWSIVDYSNTNFSSISLTGPATGIEVGEFGKIRKTPDGGISWIDLSESLTNSQLSSLQFTGPSIGYAIASYEAGTIIKTLDGGKQWEKLASGISGNFSSLYFINSTTGYATSYNYPDYQILKTGDGGNSWSLLNSTTSSYTLRDIYFISATTGLAIGENGIILRTTNQGTTWKQITSNTTLTLNSIKFFNATKGVIVGSGGVILKTSDGGASWTPSNSNITESLNSIVYADKNTGFAVGDAGSILRTTNSGKTWGKISTGYTKNLSDVYFIDSNTGYISSMENGDVLTSRDGGFTWELLPSITSAPLTSLAFPSPGTGYIAGNGGTLIRITTCDSISGPAEVLKGLSHYSVPAYSGVTYQWTISGGGRLISSGNTVNVQWNKVGTYTLTCKPSEGKTISLEVRVSDHAVSNLREVPETVSNLEKDSNSSNIEIFPNPSNGNFTIYLPKEALYTIVITDALGTEVYKSELVNRETNLKLPANLKGLFYVRITSNESTSIHKIIIE